MEKNEYQKNALDMIYLVTCALHGSIPDADRIGQLDTEKLFEVCQSHILTGCAAYALEAAGLKNAAFSESRDKAIRKNMLLDSGRNTILQKMDQEHIWYMPLKGAVLKNWYPKIGMRQMSDNDILCDKAGMEKIRDIFLAEGYTCEEFGNVNRDVYVKAPVMNFEMHSSLFSEFHFGSFYSYYEDVKARLIRDAENSFGFHFTNEDFYLYMLAHEYKHFSGGGTGVRSLVDTYVFLVRFSSTLDWEYIRKELRVLGIADFECSNRELAMKLFAGDTLSADESELLDYYIFSGTYGTYENSIANRIKKRGGGSKARYLLYRIFPPFTVMERSVPWVSKRKFLLPAAWVYRLFKGMFRSRKAVKTELKYLKKAK